MKEKTLSEEFDVPHVQKILQHSIRSLIIYGESPVPLQRVLGIINDISHSMDTGITDFVQMDLLVGLTSIAVFGSARCHSLNSKTKCNTLIEMLRWCCYGKKLSTALA